MLDWLLTFRIDRNPFLTGTLVVLGIVILFLLLRRASKRWLLTVGIALLGGAGIGVLAGWLVSDVWDTFGLPLTFVTKVWVAVAVAGVALAVVNLWRSRWWRKIVAVLCIPIIVLVSGVWVNVDFGAYPTLKDALGVAPYGSVPSADLDGKQGQMDANIAADWTPPADQPAKGILGTTIIPATTSHFAARPASVYLPPAALVKNPPVLPVIVMFSGQPGAPSDMFTSGRADTVLNAYAAKHKGIAPIIVAPDQLSAPERNPMCVDSPLGNSAQYLTVDVPNWIRTHLNVSDSKRYWAVAGYSQGGTCAMQFGAGHPELFQSILSISGELEPTIGTGTIAKGFGGSTAAYNAAKPLTLLKEHEPYKDTLAIFGAGADDAKYEAFQHTTDAAATAAGMTTQFISSPGTAHDWNTVRYILAAKLPVLSDHLLNLAS